MPQDIELFPHLLMRVSGGPFERFQKLDVTATRGVVEEIYDNRRRIRELKDSISNALHQLIADYKDTDPGLCGGLLKARRAIFNDRAISSKIRSQIEPVLPDSLKSDWAVLEETVETDKRLCQQGAQVFASELEESRNQLKELARDQNLQKGLLLSSQSLLARVNAYLTRDGSLRKKELQTERSLIKYLARMYAKTSPFSTFTNLALATVEENASGAFSVKEGKEPVIRCHIRLNNFLYQFLKGLLLSHAAVARAIPIRPNPTLRQAGDHYVYLTNSHNVEAFQRIPANPVLEVFQVIAAQQPQGLSIEAMVKQILDNEYIDAPPEEIESYIKQLVQFGFLEYNVGVSGIDPDWDVRLREVLAPLRQRIPLLGQLSDCLAGVRDMAEAYGDAPLDERRRILQNAFTLFRDTCMVIHEAAGLPEEERLDPDERQQLLEARKKEAEEEKENGEEEAFIHRSSTVFNFKPEQIFYEDTTSSVDGLVSAAHYMEFVSTLHNLLQNLKHFEGHFGEQAKMAHYFQEKYPAAGDEGVDLLTFYEDFYREFKKPEAKYEEERKKRELAGEKVANNADEAADDPFAVPGVVERGRMVERWQSYLTKNFKDGFAHEMANGLEVRYALDDVSTANREMSVASPQWNHHRSYGGFMQFFVRSDDDGGERLMAVANGTFPGYGRMFSRFLHILDPVVTEELRRHNKSLADGHLFVEDTDASYFNANLHPPLMPYEIWMPNGHNNLPPEFQIPITELKVRLNEEAGRLQLRHPKSGKDAFVFDLGFQGHRGRSQLFQLLEKFTLAPVLFAAPLNSSLNSALLAIHEEAHGENKDKTILVRPRVVFDDTIVLQRKAWRIPNVCLPLKQAEEDDWDYFLRLNIWRRELGMPSEVFLFLVDRREMEYIPPEKKTKLGRDDYKPQYICFDNPFLVNLFEKALPKAPGTVKIEEMLPASEQLLKLGKNRHITEFVVQWCTRDKQ